MDTKESISKEISDLYDEGVNLIKRLQDKDKNQNFRYEYQSWYTKSLRVVEVLAPDRYPEFKSYYEIDPKRKSLGYGTYVIQDYLKGVAPGSYQLQNFDTRAQTVQNSVNQLTILHSLLGRIDSVLANIDTELLSEIQDAELETARQLSKISLRAAGSLVGVVIENHLQKLANNHGIKSRKKHPTISDLNDPLKNEGVFDTPTWRKVTYLADIRNICSHKKDIEPTKEQINELIEGANWLIKNTF
ncbi:hypothetical protein FJD32_019275 [Shewanella sp. LC6]|jgi:hypothetical protein|uniref:HEPN domain-containing protein n=1 Tax=Shewanella xiamenensis TaxID=332186 RepID=A0ABT6UB11_9GAMM|nr:MULTISPECIES: hypothetical protein [Shewanella]MDI5831647.1 hypothetical protein [Shewanella xiamenensis]QQK61422.1 hypothetical protein FJD32_019275 [Shewanella sp. LC6]TPE62005.1 hypothetical protein FJD33_05610 [Shewanella sp. LC2]